LAICFESVVKSYLALRGMPIEGESEEDLLWYPLMYKAGWVLEPELPVVIWVPRNAASKGNKGTPLNM
jgi:hypothetical protein